jgi:hypothetical protein
VNEKGKDAPDLRPGMLLKQALMALTDPSASWKIAPDGTIRDFQRHPEGACPITWNEGLPAYMALTCLNAMSEDTLDMLDRIMAAADMTNTDFGVPGSYETLRRLFLRLVNEPAQTTVV